VTLGSSNEGTNSSPRQPEENKGKTGTQQNNRSTKFSFQKRENGRKRDVTGPQIAKGGHAHRRVPHPESMRGPLLEDGSVHFFTRGICLEKMKRRITGNKKGRICD